jgi:hypothetical protein
MLGSRQSPLLAPNVGGGMARFRQASGAFRKLMLVASLSQVDPKQRFTVANLKVSDGREAAIRRRSGRGRIARLDDV